MTYVLYDVILQRGYPFSSRSELITWWLRNYGYDFSDFAMNPNDTYAPDVGFPVEPVRRRYMVYDQMGRVVDIRTWDMAHILAPKSRSQRVYTGKRDHEHRLSGPAMRRNQMRRQTETERFCPVTGYPIPPVRNTADWDLSSYYAKKFMSKYSGSRCWKDQAKSGRQFAKHSPVRGHAPERARVTEEAEPANEFEAIVDDYFDYLLQSIDETA